uniref:Dehydrogenase/reductase SDR family member 4 n=1 Tax=Bos taurus TaxID=9913 RepID=DHRS4_BOVIN|nr:RecName: Full=Dehydrogenase/reductase SDR family member 4; AltName: Full=NADPH-dependent carbonyl reductase; Short=CR; AltName: Full=NADPH-dependent retinol dehydrogenase/reductase; Short=NDRD; AltName: Full=Peroxisomal short-chain alcohol dehydrogenase; Short=PSCD; AltName: Full=Short chain dehydrogenase/reductase family 25C member 2; Short=Protein SDR25C2 [Bos taurus]
MLKVGLPLGACARSWKSVRMASCGMARRNPLDNKVALVTASTDGIGFAIARRLAQDGAHVVVSSRKQQNVDRAVATLKGEGLSVTGTVCHVGKAEDRERLVATAVKLHGGVDILISNAAVSPFFGSLMDVPEEVWDKILDVNVKATALLTKAVVPEMAKRGGGSIVIVSSIAAYSPFPSLGPYNVSKTALLGLTKNLALELAESNVRVNCLAPGLIRTSFSRVLWEDPARQESIKATFQIKRIGKPEECAGIVSFLCSEDASYITGETVVVAGGSLSHL